ncbi:MAG TPA: (2Fe-2S)-binding protein [Candidatus Limnocylindria bacterium]|nr:(2Fe-2S)-binding protein [Candidatus Limnocylindria bacterium]
MSTLRIGFTANGTARVHQIPAEMLLIELLRDVCGLTGTKEGCSVGVCGACSVLVDGVLVSACLVPAVHVDGREVTTVEGLAAPDGTLSALQERFIVDGGFQCGICTPGQLIAATALLRERPKPEEREIREWMMGNLCRCTGYQRIVDAVRGASA